MAFGNRLTQLRRDWAGARQRHPRLVSALATAFFLVAAVSVGGGVWFLAGLRHGLPEYDALGRMSDMAQSTTVFDDHDQIAFTIYKEQRIQVPLADISPNLVKALIAI